MKNYLYVVILLGGLKIEKQIPGVFSPILSSPHLMEEMKMLPGPISRKKCVAKLVSREGPATALFLPHCLPAFYKEKLSSKGKFYHQNIRKGSYSSE